MNNSCEERLVGLSTSPDDLLFLAIRRNRSAATLLGIPASDIPASDIGLRTFRLRASGIRLRTSDIGLRTSCFGHQTSGIGHSGIRHRASDIGQRALPSFHNSIFPYPYITLFLPDLILML
ncbi:MAG: hypothetical protein IPL46_28855 [Saprospiraceae bacterium]|nr:hypothetical protein [Saprospiraceae bacterium]